MELPLPLRQIAVSGAGMFEKTLREWRNRRGLSQMDLAMAAEISPRHLSFLESARAKPSAAMVMRLAAALDLPLRERNGMLVAAGFAPHFGESDWHSEDMRDLRQAAQLLLAAHAPYPALVLDATFGILDANDAAWSLIGGLPTDGGRPNLAELVFCPGPVREAIINWDEVAAYLLERLREAAQRHGPQSAPARLMGQVLRQDGATSLNHRLAGSRHAALLPLEFRVEGAITRWFTTVTSFGGPQDALAEEITIEQFHPVRK